MRDLTTQERMQKVMDSTMELTIELVKLSEGNGDIAKALEITRQIQNDEIELINLLNEVKPDATSKEEDLKIFEFMELK